jgi:hypothetical protein
MKLTTCQGHTQKEIAHNIVPSRRALAGKMQQLIGVFAISHLAHGYRFSKLLVQTQRSSSGVCNTDSRLSSQP